MKNPLVPLLRSFGACDSAIEWGAGRIVGPEAWNACERPDWMFWLCARAGVSRRLLVLAACACARHALRHVPAGELRPLRAIETTERWTRGEATIEEVRTAREGARDAYAADDAADASSAAVYAAHAAASAADSAAHAAASAVVGAVGVADAAYDRELATSIRTVIPWRALPWRAHAWQYGVLGSVS